MLSLIYVSSAVAKFSGAGLVVLLSQSREKNARLGITGMLLYKDGNFIHVLEGPNDAVEQMFTTICADDRHRGAICLLRRQIEEREFPDWAMGFRNLNDPAVRTLPGYSEFMNEPLTSEKFLGDGIAAWRLLMIFRRNMGC
jgi:hypothetical protein